MADYSSWTDRQIDIEIAKRDGWYAYSAYVNNWIIVAGHEKPYTRLNYMFLHRMARKYSTEVEAWENEVPQWSDDSRLGDSIELLKECNGTLWYDHVIQLWEVIIELPGDDENYLMTNCESAARACCEAWLMWKDWKNGQ